MTDFSRAGATLRFEYDEHRHAYGYLFHPGGGAKSCLIDVHGGGWAEPHKEWQSDRMPSKQLVTRTDILEAFIARGGCAIVLEYPLGSALTSTAEQGPNAEHFPGNWVIMARAFQWIADQCMPGGLLEGYVLLNERVAIGSSAGTDQVAFTQWTPLSLNMVPRWPLAKVQLDRSLVFSDQYLRAMVLTAPSGSFIQADPSRQGNGGFNPAIAALANPYRFRPRVRITATLTQGGTALAAGDVLDGTGAAVGRTLVVVSTTGPGVGAVVVALVQAGLAADFTVADTFEKRGSVLTTLTVLTDVTITDKYGWLELPRDWLRALSFFQLIQHWTGLDLERVRAIPIWAACNGNPSVQYHASDPDDVLVPGLYGADDGYDIMALEQRLNELGGFTFQTYWGENPAAGATSAVQTILDASLTNPIRITTNGPENGVRTGDTVKIDGVLGNGAANGIFSSTRRISGTVFEIGAVGSGAYTGGGRWAFHNAKANYSIGASWPTQICDWLRDVVGLSIS